MPTGLISTPRRLRVSHTIPNQVDSAELGRTALGATVAGGVLTGLASAPERMSRLFRHRFPMVAVTGMTGVGKSQLVDRLTRRSSGDGVAEVGSAVMERRTRRSARLQGFRFQVVPGDNAATRLGALDEVFHDEPVDGVIHVVANGHATPADRGHHRHGDRDARSSSPPSSRTGRSRRTGSPRWPYAVTSRSGSS